MFHMTQWYDWPIVVLTEHGWGAGEGDLVSTMPVRVCPKLKVMGHFSASIE